MPQGRWRGNDRMKDDRMNGWKTEAGREEQEGGCHLLADNRYFS